MHGVGFTNQRERRESLQGRCGADLGVDGVREGSHVGGGSGCVFRIRVLAHVGDAGADGEVGGCVWAQGGDGAGALAAEDVGEGRGVVDA